MWWHQVVPTRIDDTFGHNFNIGTEEKGIRREKVMAEESQRGKVIRLAERDKWITTERRESEGADEKLQTSLTHLLTGLTHLRTSTHLRTGLTHLRTSLMHLRTPPAESTCGLTLLTADFRAVTD